MSISSFKISVPNPCFNSWEEMQINDKGRHCNSCNKTVIDFSLLSDQQVEQYFVANHSENICGRFYKTQLTRINIKIPNYVFKKKMATWKKFLLVFLICFGQSIFSLEIKSLGTNLYAQGTPVRSHYARPQKKSPKHKRKKSTTSIFLNQEIMVLGYCQHRDSHDNLLMLEPVKSNLVLDNSEDTSISQTGTYPTDPIPKKKEQKSNDALLPALILFKRKKISK